jgi:hypothetical protein
MALRASTADRFAANARQLFLAGSLPAIAVDTSDALFGPTARERLPAEEPAPHGKRARHCGADEPADQAPEEDTLDEAVVDEERVRQESGEG